MKLSNSSGTGLRSLSSSRGIIAPSDTWRHCCSKCCSSKIHSCFSKIHDYNGTGVLQEDLRFPRQSVLIGCFIVKATREYSKALKHVRACAARFSAGNELCVLIRWLRIELASCRKTVRFRLSLSMLILTLFQGQCTFSGQQSRQCAPACTQSCARLCARKRVKRA